MIEIGHSDNTRVVNIVQTPVPELLRPVYNE